jgi:hypothetical protein
LGGKKKKKQNNKYEGLRMESVARKIDCVCDRVLRSQKSSLFVDSLALLVLANACDEETCERKAELRTKSAEILTWYESNLASEPVSSAAFFAWVLLRVRASLELRGLNVIALLRGAVHEKWVSELTDALAAYDKNPYPKNVTLGGEVKEANVRNCIFIKTCVAPEIASVVYAELEMFHELGEMEKLAVSYSRVFGPASYPPDDWFDYDIAGLAMWTAAMGHFMACWNIIPEWCRKLKVVGVNSCWPILRR